MEIDSAMLNLTTSESQSLARMPLTSDNLTACHVYHHLYPDPTNAPAAIISFGICYSLIFVLGIAGNSSVVYVTLSNRSLQTVQNIFILNLAMADIFVCFLSLPVTPIANIYKEWYFGKMMCHLIPWVQGTSLFISTFTLTGIAVDRYFLILHPHFPPIQRRTALLLILLIWSISGAVTVPYAYYMKVVSYTGLCGNFCDEDWPPKIRRGFTILYLFAQFVLPLLVISVCYAKILDKLQSRINVKLARIVQQNECLHFEVSNAADEAQRSKREIETEKLIQQRRRTTMILGSMVLIFAVTWLPNNVVALLTDYDAHIFNYGDGQDHIYTAHLITHCFAMLSILANPILYAWLNQTFRATILQALGSLRLTRKHKPLHHFPGVQKKDPSPPRPTYTRHSNDYRDCPQPDRHSEDFQTGDEDSILSYPTRNPSFCQYGSPLNFPLTGMEQKYRDSF